MRIGGTFFLFAQSCPAASAINDSCFRFSMRTFNKESHCIAETGKCTSLYWDSVDQERIVYMDEEPKESNVRQVSCAEVRFTPFHGSRKRKASRSPDKGLRNEYSLSYDATGRAEEKLRAGLSNILDTLRLKLIPNLTGWPMRPFSRRDELAAAEIKRDGEIIKSIVSLEQERVGFATECVNEFLTDQSWLKWQSHLEDWLMDLTFTGFHQVELLRLVVPYVNLHMYLLRTFSIKDRTLQLIKELLSDFSSSSGAPKDSGGFKTLVKNLVDRLRMVSGYMTDRLRYVSLEASESGPDNILLIEFEEMLASLMNREGHDDERRLKTVMESVCPRLVAFTAYVSWAWRSISRRAHRLIASAVALCRSSTSIDSRRRAILYLPVLFSHPTYFEKRQIRISSHRQKLYEESLILLRDPKQKFDVDIVVRFTESDAQGDEGPRAHWLSVVFDGLFSPDNDIFEYSDDTKRFLRPVKRPRHSDLFAVGRVIGLGIKYGLSIGARLAPCGLLTLQLAPINLNLDLEKCVKLEDHEFVDTLNRIEQLLTSTDSFAAREVLASIPGAEHVEETSFQAYKRDQLYQKGIASVRSSYLIIKQGIRSVIPVGALELFSSAELELMINGTPNLSAQTLNSGIDLAETSAITPVFKWIKDIIREENDEFRFAFHRFVTGVAQPPVKMPTDWIKIEIDTESDTRSLPRAQTCFRRLISPNYASKSILKQKLILAVFEGNESLELA